MMENKELMDFVEWLPNNFELFADMDVEAVIAQINDLASSDEGKETLEQLTKQYKSKEMGLFKKGGKLDYLLCLKSGGKGPDCGCNKSTTLQDGGEISRRNTIDKLEEIYGNRRDARKAYRDEIREGLNLSENYTRRGVKEGIHKAYADWTLTPQEAPRSLVIKTPVTPILPSYFTINGPGEELPLMTKPEKPESVVNTPTFNEAFRNARNAGLDVFEWNGNKYNTRISDSRPYVERSIAAMGTAGQQARPYWEVAAMGLSKK